MGEAVGIIAEGRFRLSGFRPRNMVVIPAKAGIQALNGSRVLRATQKHNCGWLPPLHPGVHFFCSAKRNGRKKRPPGWCDNPAALLAGRTIRATGSNTRLASPDSGCDARARHTGFEKTIRCLALLFYEEILRIQLRDLIFTNLISLAVTDMLKDYLRFSEIQKP